MGASNRRLLLLCSAVSIMVVGAVAVPPMATKAVTLHRPSAAIKRGGTVVVSQGPNGSWTQNFNIWSPSKTNGVGMIWEPLLWFNNLKGGKVSPWLAKSYKWSNGGKTLTFNLRPGVKWNDGKPFTSADVLWSYQMAKKYADFGFCHCTTEVAKVTTPDALTAVFTLKKADSSMLFWIGNSEPMPTHAYGGKGDPAKLQIKSPVATGPFMLGSFSPQVFVLKRNPLYWQAGKPYVDALRYPAYTSNDSEQLALVNGEIDYGGVFIPDAQNTYASKNSNNHFWYSGTGAPVTLWLNDAEAPFNNVHVRRAINDAIDRSAISKVAEYGYEPPANGGFVMPGYAKKWGNAPAMKSAPLRPNIAAAKAELAKAKGVDVSKPMNIYVVSGWSDWVTSVQLIADQLKSIGMNLTVQPVQFGDYLTNLQQGKFDMAISWTTGDGNSPYYIYFEDFSNASGYYAPTGQTATANWGRYSNPTLNNLVTAYGKTTNTATQVTLMKKAQAVVASDVPAIPLMFSGNWYEYNTKRFAGWPSAKNQFDWPMPFAYGQGNGNLDVALHVHLK